MLYVSNIAYWKTEILRRNEMHLMGTIVKGFVGKEGVIEGGMVHGTALLTIFLVVQIEAHTVCFLEIPQRSYMGQDSAIF